MLVARRRWPFLIFIIGSGVVSGAVATSFAEFITLIVNSSQSFGVRERGVDALFEAFEKAPATSSWLSDLIIHSGFVGDFAAVMLAAILLAVLIAVIAALTGRARASVNAEIYTQLREDAFNRCFDEIRAVDIALTEDGVENARETVTLAASLNRGADSVSNTYTYLLTCLQQGFALISALITSGARIFPVTAACLAVIVMQIFIAQWLARSLRESRKTLDTATNRVQSRTAELLGAREVLLAFDKSDRYKTVLRNLVATVGHLQVRTAGAEAGYDALQELVRNWGQIAVIGFAILLMLALPQFAAITDDTGGETSALIFAITLYATLLSPARQLIGGYDSLRRSEAVVSSFLAIFGVDATPDDTGRSDGWRKNQPITLDKVTYTPPGGDRPIIDGLDLTIAPNTTTLILGPSGCGKTTLGRLCLGFLEADAGAIRIGGAPIGAWASRYLHRAISYAPQIDQILDGTLEENLRLAEDETPFERGQLEQVLDMVNLKRGRADRLDLCAKELSGGEMQRLSAARLLLDRAEILLLDEPMAGVDVFTMADIAPAVERHWRETRQTVLLISHKLVFATLATQVVILDEHGIAEMGDPRHLAQCDSVYARIRTEALRQAGG